MNNINKQKQAVMYGAGNIGRGFIAQLFYESGYETTFIDVNKELIDLINEKKEYPIKFADNESSREILIKNIRAVNGSAENLDEVADIISKADIMAVSVGVNILKFIMKPVAAGLNKRFNDKNFTPFNIILCENLIDSDKIAYTGILKYIDDEYKDLYDKKIGFVQASVGRVVPTQTDETKAGNPLRIVTENYTKLQVDKDGFKDKLPDIKNIDAYSPFKYIIERKLYIYNMGHAVCAYLGDIAGYEYIWQAIKDDYIKEIVGKAMRYTGMALEKIYGEFDFNYADDLIRRFANKSLGDTVKRVGNDLQRKLSPNDRIIGAYKICLENKLPLNHICLAIAAAVNFKGDKLSGQNLENILIAAGSYDLISEIPENFELIKKYDDMIKQKIRVIPFC